MGGSDQWGNITTGTELIRRMEGGDAFALTCPLITKADGTKFGKTEGGNVWLDPAKTSPYKFYQFWLNCSDVDAARYIRIFTLLRREEIEECERQAAEAPEKRILQRALAKDITCRVHSQHDYDMAVSASELLFGKGTTEQLNSLDRDLMLTVFEGVPQFGVSRATIENGVSLIDLAAETGMFASKGEIRRELKQNSISVNKVKVGEDCRLTASDILSCGSILIQKGKKSYYLLNVE
jgi:tyrosyl-tRNA synthetase